MKDLESLSQVFSTAKYQELRQLVEGGNLVLKWEEIVREPIASETRALKYINGVLYVEVSGSVWANELTYLKSAIIEKLNKQAEKAIVKDIKFVVRGVRFGKREQCSQSV